MNLKRFCSILCVIILFAFCFSGSVFAAEVSVSESALPTLRAEIFGSKAELDAPVSAAIDGTPIELTGLNYTYATEFVFYIDISTSVNSDGFDAAKELVGSVADSLEPGESVSLYTFGNELCPVLDRCTDTAQIRDAIDGLQMDNDYTCFYEAMIHALTNYSTDSARCFFVSDGENSLPEESEEFNYEAMMSVAAESSAYVQALCYDSADEEQYAAFYEITVASGGFYHVSAEELEAHDDAIQSERAVSCEAEFTVPDSYAPNSSALLTVMLGEESLEAHAFDTGDWPESAASPDEPETVTTDNAPKQGLSFPYLLLIPILLIVAALVFFLLRRKATKNTAAFTKKSSEPAASSETEAIKDSETNSAEPAEEKLSQKQAAKKAKEEKKSFLFYFDP